MTFPVGIQSDENITNNLLVTSNSKLLEKVNTDLNAVLEFMKLDISNVEKVFANPIGKNARDEEYYSVILKTTDNKMYSFSYIKSEYI